MASDSENGHSITDAEQTWDFDELAARAGAAVRRPAPEHGAAEVARRGHRHRVVTTLVAGSAVVVLIAVGVALVRAGSQDSTSSVATTPLDIGGSSIARAALISVDQLGPGWSAEFPISSLAPWREESAAQPECAEYTAAVQPLEATAPGAVHSFVNLQNQVVGEMLTIYPSKDAASRAMDSMEAPGFKECFFATFDADSARGFPGSGATSTSFNIAPPAPHGDRQIAFGQETRTAVDSRTRLYLIVFVQIGRSIITLNVSPDGLRSDDPAGLVERSISAAIASLNAALPAG